MRANWEESLPPAAIVDREELEARRYLGFNPAFVRRVWAKRREDAGNKPLPKKVWTEERKAQVYAYLDGGMSLGRVAQKMGVTRCAIAGMLRYDRANRERAS